MSRPKSSAAPTRERRGGKVLLTIWCGLYRVVGYLSGCCGCAVATFLAASLLLILLGVLK